MAQILARALLTLLESLITKELMDKVQVEIVAYLRAKAKETTNDLDDATVEIVAKALGVK